MNAVVKNGQRGQRRLPWIQSADAARSYGGRFSRWIACLASPPERWSGTHRLVSYVALAAAAFAIGTHGWRAAGIGASTASGVGLTELERRVDDARAAIARLPALKEAARKHRAFPDEASHSPTAQWQAVSSLAARCGLSLRSLEPGARSGDGLHAARLVRIAARANFAAFFAFLQGLPTLPSLVVPTALHIERADEGLVIDATLQLYDALPAGPYPSEAPAAAPDDGPGWFADPFATAGADAGELRLLGLMHREALGLALFETGDGAAVYVPGQAVGAARIVSIDARGVTLASRGERRVMTLSKEEAL